MRFFFKLNWYEIITDPLWAFSFPVSGERAFIASYGHEAQVQETYPYPRKIKRGANEAYDIN